MTPAAEIDQLKYFAGVWEGEGRFLATQLDPAAAQPALRVEAQFRHGGHWLEQRFVWIEKPSDGGGLDVVEATRVWGYNSVRREFICEWFDSRGRRATVTSAGWQDDRLLATSTIVDADREIRLRETFIRCSDHEWRHVGEQDHGQGWVLADEQTLRRISG